MLFDGLAMRIGSAEAVDMSLSKRDCGDENFFNSQNSSNRSVIDNTDGYMRKAALGSPFVDLVFPSWHVLVIRFRD